MTARSLRYLPESFPDRLHCQMLMSFNAAVARAGVPATRHQPLSVMPEVGRFLSKARLVRNLVKWGEAAYLVGMAWPSEARLFPIGYIRETIPLIFDCWPPDYDKWDRLFARHRFRVVFFTARGSAEYFRPRLPDATVYWLPEAGDPGRCDTGPILRERTIDVLELGRRFGRFHHGIGEPLERAGYTHLYVKNGPVFPCLEGLRGGLAQSKLAVCFPKSMTHPEAALGLETVTLRYFEAIGSGCLLIGHGPAELEEIFGYNPVIEADLDDPATQVQSILRSIEDYQPWVERNYKRFLEVGTWEPRIQTMLDCLAQHGYRLPESQASTAQSPA